MMNIFNKFKKKFSKKGDLDENKVQFLREINDLFDNFTVWEQNIFDKNKIEYQMDTHIILMK